MQQQHGVNSISSFIGLSSVALAIFIVIGTSVAIASSDASAHKATISANDEDFATIETECRMLSTQINAGGVNMFDHFHQVTSQKSRPGSSSINGIYYSNAVVNVSEGATLTLPKTAARLSVQVITEDHHLQPIHYGSGTIELKANKGDFVFVIVRLEADMDDNTASELQQKMQIDAGNHTPYDILSSDILAKDSFDNNL